MVVIHTQYYARCRDCHPVVFRTTKTEDSVKRNFMLIISGKQGFNYIIKVSLHSAADSISRNVLGQILTNFDII
jgi:hypothetical protein